MRIATTSASLAFLLGLWAPALAQHQATISFVTADPRGTFDINTDAGFGVSGSYLYALTSNRAIAVGATGSFLRYGSASRRLTVSSALPGFQLDVDTNNDTVFTAGVVQFKAPFGEVEPYAQGMAGVGIFYTRTSVKNIRNDENIDSFTDNTDATFVWGGGGGLLVQLYQGKTEPPPPEFEEVEKAREPVRVYLDLGARYLKGNEVSYLREGTLPDDVGDFDVDPRLVETQVEAVRYEIGVTVQF